MKTLIAFALMLLGGLGPAIAQSNAPGNAFENRALQSGCAQGSNSGMCRQFGPPRPPERPYTPPRSSGEIAPPMERVTPVAPLSPRVGN
jgi:hypothetical protein